MTRKHKYEGVESPTIVTKTSPIQIRGDTLEVARRQGYIIALDLAPDKETLNGYVEFVGSIAYRVKLGSFGKLALPISSGHYYDLRAKTVIQMDAIRPPPGLYIPR